MTCTNSRLFVDKDSLKEEQDNQMSSAPDRPRAPSGAHTNYSRNPPAEYHHLLVGVTHVCEPFYIGDYQEIVLVTVWNNYILQNINNFKVKPQLRDFGLLYTDNTLTYEGFDSDFGPLNLAMLYRYTRRIANLMGPANNKNRLIHMTVSRNKTRVNSVFLMGAYCIMYEGYSPEEALAKFMVNNPPELIPFRDAAAGSCTYQLRMIDCFRAIKRAMDAKFLDFRKFNVSEYQHYERVENGDLNWIMPQKFIAFCGPHDRQQDATLPQHPPERYFSYFRKNNVTDIIRLNKAMYDREKFVSAGFRHWELFFIDGSTPSDQIVKEFLDICENTQGGIAVHCKAGLGRTGSLIGCYIMKHFRFSAREAIAWIRICRPGSVIGYQQNWLEKKEAQMWALSGKTDNHFGICVRKDPPPSLCRGTEDSANNNANNRAGRSGDQPSVDDLDNMLQGLGSSKLKGSRGLGQDSGVDVLQCDEVLPSTPTDRVRRGKDHSSFGFSTNDADDGVGDETVYDPVQYPAGMTQGDYLMQRKRGIRKGFTGEGASLSSAVASTLTLTGLTRTGASTRVTSPTQDRPSGSIKKTTYKGQTATTPNQGTSSALKSPGHTYQTRSSLRRSMDQEPDPDSNNNNNNQSSSGNNQQQQPSSGSGSGSGGTQLNINLTGKRSPSKGDRLGAGASSNGAGIHSDHSPTSSYPHTQGGHSHQNQSSSHPHPLSSLNHLHNHPSPTSPSHPLHFSAPTSSSSPPSPQRPCGCPLPSPTCPYSLRRPRNRSQSPLPKGIPSSYASSRSGFMTSLTPATFSNLNHNLHPHSPCSYPHLPCALSSSPFLPAPPVTRVTASLSCPPPGHNVNHIPAPSSFGHSTTHLILPCTCPHPPPPPPPPTLGRPCVPATYRSLRLRGRDTHPSSCAVYGPIDVGYRTPCSAPSCCPLHLSTAPVSSSSSAKCVASSSSFLPGPSSSISV